MNPAANKVTSRVKGQWVDRPKTTWRRTVEAETETAGRMSDWNTARVVATDRVGMEAQCYGLGTKRNGDAMMMMS